MTSVSDLEAIIEKSEDRGDSCRPQPDRGTEIDDVFMATITA